LAATRSICSAHVRRCAGDEIGDVLRRVALGIDGVALGEAGRKIANGLREARHSLSLAR
jgi:hypothetical protein